MLTTITIVVLIAAIVVLSYFLFCFSERIDDLKLDLEIAEQVNESKQTRIEVLIDKETSQKARINKLLVQTSTLTKDIEDKNNQINELLEKVEFIIKQRDRWLNISKTLYSRNKKYSIGITRFKREDTDIRVLRVYARDELAIELQKDGLITYKMSENWREDLQETEVKVTASINVNKINP